MFWVVALIYRFVYVRHIGGESFVFIGRSCLGVWRQTRWLVNPVFWLVVFYWDVTSDKYVVDLMFWVLSLLSRFVIRQIRRWWILCFDWLSLFRGVTSDTWVVDPVTLETQSDISCQERWLPKKDKKTVAQILSIGFSSLTLVLFYTFVPAGCGVTSGGRFGLAQFSNGL
jgi:hypothetical protein